MVPAGSSCRCLRPQCWDLRPEAGVSQVQILLLGRDLASGAGVCFLGFPVSSSIQVLPPGMPHSHSPWQTLSIPPILSLWDRCTTVTEGKIPAWIPSFTCLKLQVLKPGGSMNQACPSLNPTLYSLTLQKRNEDIGYITEARLCMAQAWNEPTGI